VPCAALSSLFWRSQSSIQGPPSWPNSLSRPGRAEGFRRPPAHLPLWPPPPRSRPALLTSFALSPLLVCGGQAEPPNRNPPLVLAHPRSFPPSAQPDLASRCPSFWPHNLSNTASPPPPFPSTLHPISRLVTPPRLCGASSYCLDSCRPSRSLITFPSASPPQCCRTCGNAAGSRACASGPSSPDSATDGCRWTQNTLSLMATPSQPSTSRPCGGAPPAPAPTRGSPSRCECRCPAYSSSSSPFCCVLV
jgi:hypothetical protein